MYKIRNLAVRRHERDPVKAIASDILNFESFLENQLERREQPCSFASCMEWYVLVTFPKSLYLLFSHLSQYYNEFSRRVMHCSTVSVRKRKRSVDHARSRCLFVEPTEWFVCLGHAPAVPVVDDRLWYRRCYTLIYSDLIERFSVKCSCFMFWRA